MAENATTGLARPAAATEVSTLDLSVGGMTCSSCAVHVEKVLGRQPGVAYAHMNFAGGSHGHGRRATG